MRLSFQTATAVAAFSAALCLGNIGSASATPVTTTNADLEHGWYDGTGTSNGAFTVVTDTDIGIQIGLRAKLRQDAGLIHTSTNTYTVPVGFEPVPPDSTPHTHVAWNLEWAIDLSLGSLNLGDIYANSTITLTDNTTGHTQTVPLTHWTDYSTNGPLGIVNETALSPTDLQHQTGAEQSENPIYPDFFNPGISFDANAKDSYTATLNVKNNAGTLLATDSININAVPEASSVSMVGASLLGLLAFGFIPGLRRKMRSGAMTA